MKTLYIDCSMGAAGDMLAASLLELDEKPQEVLEILNGMGLPGVEFRAEKVQKCGVSGTHLSVVVNGTEEEPGDAPHEHEHDHEHRHEGGAYCEHEHSHEGWVHYEHEHSHEDRAHHGHEHKHGHIHRSMADIEALVSSLRVDDGVKKNVMAVYRLIAGAESRVHGTEVSEIHFHEVGSMDAVADITAVCLLMSRLAPEHTSASPVCTGSGTVRCAHGILPVPAPATALLLTGIPSYAGVIRSELCTPTGAALLRFFADEFVPQPLMTVEKIGCGAGKKDFEAANLLRTMIGETPEKAGADRSAADAKDASEETHSDSRDQQDAEAAKDREEGRTDGPTDRVCELLCQVDDMTAEEIAFAGERLFAGGALDVFTTPVGMKKGRPGTMITCICRPEKCDEMVRTMFRHTTTLGIRVRECLRRVLLRSERTEEGPAGPVRIKTSYGYGVKREKAEYDDLASAAVKTGKTLREMRENARDARRAD